MGLGQQIGEALFAKDEKIKELEAEVDRLRAAILSFGNGNDFDWNVLGRIDELELEIERLRDLVKTLESACEDSVAFVAAFMGIEGGKDGNPGSVENARDCLKKIRDALVASKGKANFRCFWEEPGR